MDKQMTRTVMRTDLHEHPAAKAWMNLTQMATAPDEIQTLKHGLKAWIFRLTGVGPGGASIIAKRCKRKKAMIERTIYEEVLPSLPVTAVRSYGFAEDPESRFCWLFLEDTDGEAYSPRIKEHRALAARWLGLMHTSAARVAKAADLPDRSPGWYLRLLQSGRKRFVRSTRSLSLNADDVAVLKSVISELDNLETRWDKLDQFCEVIPSTLLHLDFNPKNVFVRSTTKELTLLPIDWEVAGWGIPAQDLVGAEINIYRSVVRDEWPDLSIHAIQRLANIGTLFWFIRKIYFYSYQIQNGKVDWSVNRIRQLNVDVPHLIQAAGLGR
jgi:hypothetical protein